MWEFAGKAAALPTLPGSVCEFAGKAAAPPNTVASLLGQCGSSRVGAAALQVASCRVVDVEI